MSIFLSNKLQFKVFLAGTGLCSLYLLGNSYYYFLNGLGKFVGGSRFTSFFDSPSGFTWSLLYLFPFLIISPYLIFQKKIKLNKILRGILLLFFSILLILTQSRSGLIACVTGSLIYLWTKNKYIKSKMDSLRRGYFLNSIVVILLIFGCFVFVKLAFGDYLDIYLLRASNSLSEYSDGRFSDFNSITGNMNLKDFILGIGFKNSEFLSERAIRFHNAFVLFFLEGGLLTGISIVLMMYYYFSQGIKSLILSKKNFDQYSLLLGIISIFIFSVIMMLNTQSIHRMYWIGFAIVEAYSKRISSDIRS
ncbi:hypothetical protein HA150_07155 [Prochlorococcus marinus XMU1414]|nr:hypothetical protein [Prochlorococcus marinus]MBO8228676.1 hypothetical protein [Prochlorococcus marinus XMU1414]